jgi:hypothetical protein
MVKCGAVGQDGQYGQDGQDGQDGLERRDARHSVDQRARGVQIAIACGLGCAAQ